MAERNRRLEVKDEDNYCDICGNPLPEKFIYLDAIELFRKDTGIVYKKMYNLFHIECWKDKSEN